MFYHVKSQQQTDPNNRKLLPVLCRCHTSLKIKNQASSNTAQFSIIKVWSTERKTNQHDVQVTCHFFTLSLCHLITLSPCHYVTLSPCHLVTMSPCHHVTMSPCHLVNISPYHHFTIQPNPPVTMSPHNHVTISPSHYAVITMFWSGCHHVPM